MGETLTGFLFGLNPNPGSSISSSKAELRRRLALPQARPTQTHSVFIGKFRYPAYLDDDVVRCLQTGDVLARRGRTYSGRPGWFSGDHQVKVVAVTLFHGKYDDIKPLNKEPVIVHLDKGAYY